jgi:hypothetical protein
MQKISLNYLESHAILIGWMRYCLTRQSYAVSECTDFLKARWEEIDPKTQTIILRDIKEAISDDDKTLEFIKDKLADADNHAQDLSVYRRWMECDRVDWERLVELIHNAS